MGLTNMPGKKRDESKGQRRGGPPVGWLRKPSQKKLSLEEQKEFQYTRLRKDSLLLACEHGFVGSYL